MIVSWYDEKLRKQPRTLPAIPDLCVTFSDDEGKPMHDIAYGGLQVPVRETEVKLMQSGWLEFLFEPAESLLSTIAPVGAVKTAEEMDTQGGWLRPAFIPLKMAEESQDMAGIPLISLQLSTTDSDKDGTVYIAIGIKEPGSPHIKVLGDQYTPLIGDGHYQMDLPAIAYQLKPGDVVGLVVQGFTAQYFLDPEGWFSFGTVSGSVQLPLHSSVALANHP
jgi:ABC-2 type transport system ATP-binding protein